MGDSTSAEELVHHEESQMHPVNHSSKLIVGTLRTHGSARADLHPPSDLRWAQDSDLVSSVGFSR